MIINCTICGYKGKSSPMRNVCIDCYREINEEINETKKLEKLEREIESKK